MAGLVDGATSLRMQVLIRLRCSTCHSQVEAAIDNQGPG